MEGRRVVPGQGHIQAGKKGRKGAPCSRDSAAAAPPPPPPLFLLWSATRVFWEERGPTPRILPARSGQVVAVEEEDGAHWHGVLAGTGGIGIWHHL